MIVPAGITTWSTCPDCNGSGLVTHTKGAFNMSRTCPKCQVQGEFIGVPCKACAGRGQQKEAQGTPDV